MRIRRTLPLAAALTIGASGAMATVAGVASAYPVPGPDRCEVFLAHELGIPGFHRDDPANASLLEQPQVAALLARPACTATRTIPPACGVGARRPCACDSASSVPVPAFSAMPTEPT